MRETAYDIGLREKGLALTIALLADLHDHPYDSIIQSLKAHKPDIIAIAGDTISGNVEFHHPENDAVPMIRLSHVALPFFSACASLAPTYVSLGNHECYLWEDDMALIQDTGCVLLDNNWVTFPDSTAKGYRMPVLIGGLTSERVTEFRLYKKARNIQDRYFTHQDEYIGDGTPRRDWLDDFEKQEGYKILLSHHPEYWEPYIKEKRIDLVLSGHAHGGQIRFFGQGLYAPGQGFLPKYTSGVHAGPNGRMVISRGLSNTSRLIPRLMNPPEIVYLQ